MKQQFNDVFQFKIALNGIKPLIWRQIQVPVNYTFWDLHVAIQDVMPWSDCHLHEFNVFNPSEGNKERIGIPYDEIMFDVPCTPGWESLISKYFTQENNTAVYLYDFGDNWDHTVVFEKKLPRDKTVTYPVCVDGKRACPPEDCGGVHGYADFLEIVRDPSHEEHHEMLEWAGGFFDPEYFEPRKVTFDDPRMRWKIAFQTEE